MQNKLLNEDMLVSDTVARDHRLFKQAINYAVEIGILDKSPFTKSVKAPKRRQRDPNSLDDEGMPKGRKVMGSFSASANPLKNNSSLNERSEWLSARDISEIFGIGRTKAYEICAALPHIYIGRSIRVNRRTMRDELLEKGKLG